MTKPDAITDRAAVERSIKQNVSYDVLITEMQKDVVQYLRGYILARLYEAADVMDSYYQIRVNHDLAMATA